MALEEIISRFEQEDKFTEADLETYFDAEPSSPAYVPVEQPSAAETSQAEQHYQSLVERYVREERTPVAGETVRQEEQRVVNLSDRFDSITDGLVSEIAKIEEIISQQKIVDEQKNQRILTHYE